MVKKEIDSYGDIYYYNEKGQSHREDGPAVELANGTKYWCINHGFHRIGGPAVEYTDGGKQWFKNGRRHRLNAPAIIRCDNSKEYWEFGTLLIK